MFFRVFYVSTGMLNGAFCHALRKLNIRFHNQTVSTPVHYKEEWRAIFHVEENGEFCEIVTPSELFLSLATLLLTA